MTAIIPFTFEAAQVRVIERGGEPWFVLADVCGVLELSNPSMVVRQLDEDEKDALSLADPIGRQQQTTIINESGLWSLVIRSDKPAAKRFCI